MTQTPVDQAPMNQAGSGRELLVSQAFVALANTLVDEYDVIELLTRLVGYSVALLPADAAGILLADPRGQLRVVAASSEDARLTELMQLQAEQGPCLDAYASAAPVNVSDLAAAAHRWPVFVAAATAGGLPVFAAVHAVPLRLRGNAIGALNLFCHQPATIPDDALALGQALADVATIAILQERAIRRAEVLNEQLQGALNSRTVIEQAKGVLARHSGLDMEQVFNLMRRYARNHNQQLSTIARALAERTLDPNTLIPTNPTPRQPTPDTG